MFQRFQSSRAKCIVFQCTQRRWFSGDRHLLVKNSCRVLKQKTKVETIALPYLQTLTSHPVARHYSAVGGHQKTSSLFSNLYSDFSPRMLNNFHHHRALSGRLFFRNTPKSFNFARSEKPNARQNSDRSSKRTQTDSTESTFSREWKQRKTGAYYILAAFLLTGGTVYYYQHYSKVSESSCETEVDVPEKETRKKYGLNKTTDTLNSLPLQEAITQATDLCQRVKDESGAPGLVVAVSVDGRPVWTEGMGYADIENRLPCKPESVICIASISKPLTMTAIAKAVENGDLDLDKPVQLYVPQYPEKTLDGKKVTMTTRQLVSHLGGVRHYSKKYISKTPPPQSDDSASASESEMKKKKEEKESTSSEKASTSNQPAEFKQEEYYIKDKYESTEAALALFKDDPLVHKPGSKFLYTTHAWTLLAAALEGATKTKYPVLMCQLFHDLGLSSTYLNDSEPLIYHRVRNYIRNKKGRLVNAPYVDCSYKYAGGGILSTMSDLVHFGDAMLYSYQYQGLSTHEKETKAVTVKKADSPSYNNNNNNNKTAKTTTGTPPLPGYLKASTVEELWTPVKLAKMNRTTLYGMGWMMPAKKTPTFGFGRKDRMYVYHTGGAVGASSILLILPSENVIAAGGGEKDSAAAAAAVVLPRGVCVAIAVNMIAVDLHKMALQIAQLFEEVV